jgi:16S rRNA (cytidine1402-2'-O)-methyltransferase
MLYLLPNLLSPEQKPDLVFSEEVRLAVKQLDGLIAESSKEAYKYLKHFGCKDLQSWPVEILNEHTKDLSPILDQLKEKKTWGLMSDAGLPCIADPGSSLVLKAHQMKIPVKAFGVSSAIIQSLMLSGFGGQCFSFHGYLGRKPEHLKKELLQLEKKSFLQNSTEIFIEAPYRSGKTFEAMIESLRPTTYVCAAQDLGSPHEMVIVDQVKNLRSKSILPKSPTTFLIKSFKK